MSEKKLYLIVLLILGGIIITPQVLGEFLDQEIDKGLVNIPYVERVQILSSHVFFGIVKDTECKYVYENDVKTIKTYVTFEVKNTIKGETPNEVLVIYEGGIIGNDAITVMYNPGTSIQLKKGQEVTIYANKISNEYHTYYVQSKTTKEEVPDAKFEEAYFIQPRHSLISIPEIYGEGFAFDGIHFDISDHPNSYYINQYGTNDIYGTTDEFNAIKAAFNTWNNAPYSNTGFAYVTLTTKGVNLYDNYAVVLWKTTSGVPWLSRTHIRWNPSTLQMYEWDIELNDYFAWCIGEVEDKYDVRNAVTHEAGHALKLLDLMFVENAAKTMYWFIIPDSTYQRSLEPGDIGGASFIYPD